MSSSANSLITVTKNNNTNNVVESSSIIKHPPIAWSQLRDSISIIVGVQDATDVKIEVIENNNFNTAASSSSSVEATVDKSTSSSSSFNIKISLRDPKLPKNVLLACEHTLFGSIEPALSSEEIKPRGVYLSLVKKRNNNNNASEPWFWPRLMSSNAKNANIVIDWNSWKDEDDLEEMGSAGYLYRPNSSVSHNNKNSDSNTDGNSSTSVIRTPKNNSGGGGGSFLNAENLAALGGGGVALSENYTGGLTLESDEVQKTLAALRLEQIKIKLEQEEKQFLLQQQQQKSKKQKAINDDTKVDDEKRLDKKDENDDDDDELPPLV